MSVFRVTSKPTFRELSGRFAKANQTLLDVRREEMRDLARQHVSILQRHAPRKTGAFAAGHRFRTYQRGDTIGYSTSAPQPLGKWLRPPGTRPHVIVPKASGYPLRFEVNGRIVRTYRVNHPGYRPKSDYVEDAYNEFRPQLQTALRRISTRYAAEVAS